MKFLVVDDHPITRRGIRDLLEERWPAAEALEASDAVQAMALIRRHQFAVVILDLSLPGMSGLEALGNLGRDGSSPRVLVLTLHADSEYAVQSLRAGAAGFLTKQDTPESLVVAVERILAGERYLGAELAGKVALRLAGGDSPLAHASLSAREMRVMCLLAEGIGITDIAQQMSLSPKTVSTYRARVLTKTGFRSNADLTRYCLAQGLIR